MKKTVSKGKRILCNALMIVVVLMLVDFLSGASFLIPELQFRREERGHLLGPSRILGTEEIDHDYYNRMIVADTGDGGILWLYGEELGRTQFLYRRRYEENLLIAGTGNLGFMFVTDELHLPVVLFDREPRAARAELRFTLNVVYNGEEFEKCYDLEAERSAQGYFLFTLDTAAEGAVGLAAEGAAIQDFANVSADLDKRAGLFIPVEIRFYDLNGQLIGMDTVTVCSEAAMRLKDAE